MRPVRIFVGDFAFVLRNKKTRCKVYHTHTHKIIIINYTATRKLIKFFLEVAFPSPLSTNYLYFSRTSPATTQTQLYANEYNALAVPL